MRGSWYVCQGGGRYLNHHVDVPEQRGAVDLLQVGRSGSYRGDPRELTSYHAYGAEVFAPCDGWVVAAVDGLADQVPGVIRYGPLYGNHVFIDTGTELVKLAHLLPGSVAVTVGQEVGAGQLLGRIGNSGNSSEPHLHLHAERQGRGLDLVFADVGGRLHRGRTVRAGRPRSGARWTS
ncbi:M23 family metallopeptidase [Kitasatospora sp. NPDC056138]|uniref:M23 family metallopeptidase n=1 Tax=Kitasatospora sp. NPDC056138 TaxID=3345724 RepID=UPI0035D9A11A